MRSKFDVLFDKVGEQFGYSQRRTDWLVYVVGMLRGKATDEDFEKAKHYFERLGGFDNSEVRKKEKKENV